MSCKKIVIASSKGGVGKSTMTVNIADALTARGKTALMIDCDFGMRCLDILTGVESDVVYDLGDAAAGVVPLADAVVKLQRHVGLSLVAAPYGEENEPDRERFCELLDEAERILAPDYIFIDTPGGMSNSLKYAAPVCDIAIIVTTQAPSAIRAAERTSLYLEKYGAAKRRLIINKFDTAAAKSGALPGIVEIIDRSRTPLLGVVPDDEALCEAEERRMLVGESDERVINSAAAFTNIAARLEGRTVPLFTGFKSFNRKKAIKS